MSQLFNSEVRRRKRRLGHGSGIVKRTRELFWNSGTYKLQLTSPLRFNHYKPNGKSVYPVLNSFTIEKAGQQGVSKFFYVAIDAGTAANFFYSFCVVSSVSTFFNWAIFKLPNNRPFEMDFLTPLDFQVKQPSLTGKQPEPDEIIISETNRPIVGDTKEFYKDPMNFICGGAEFVDKNNPARIRGDSAKIISFQPGDRLMFAIRTQSGFDNYVDANVLVTFQLNNTKF